MSGRLLSFKEYLGGANNVQMLEVFPITQKSFSYDFGADVSGYTFTADYQSILLDTVTYDRTTGLPNLAETKVAGYFDNTTSVNASFIDVSDAANGNVVFTIPQYRYTVNILPSTRVDVVATIVSFQWEDAGTPAQFDMHRWCLLERWDPAVGSNPGSPRLNTGSQPAFVELTS